MLPAENYKTIKRIDNIINEKLALLCKDDLNLNDSINEIYLSICTDYNKITNTFNGIWNDEIYLSAYGADLFHISLDYLISNKKPKGDLINISYLINFFETLIENKQEIEKLRLKQGHFIAKNYYFYQGFVQSVNKLPQKYIWLTISSNSELFLSVINKIIQYLKESQIDKIELNVEPQTNSNINNLLSQLNINSGEELEDDIFNILKLIKYDKPSETSENGFFKDMAINILCPIILYLILVNSKQNKSIKIDDVLKVLKYHKLVSKNYYSLLSTFKNIDLDLIKHITFFEGHNEFLSACGRKYGSMAINSENLMGNIVDTAINYLENLEVNQLKE